MNRYLISVMLENIHKWRIWRAIYKKRPEPSWSEYVKRKSVYSLINRLVTYILNSKLYTFIKEIRVLIKACWFNGEYLRLEKVIKLPVAA